MGSSVGHQTCEAKRDMRERHNIIGSEVGRPRPPVYLRAPSKVQKRRFPILRTVALGLLVLVLVPVLLALLLLLLR